MTALTIFIDYMIQVFTQPSLTSVPRKHGPRVRGTQPIIIQVSVKLPESMLDDHGDSSVFTVDDPTNRVFYALQKNHQDLQVFT